MIHELSFAFRTKWWMWNCLGFELKQLAILMKKSVVLESMPSFNQEWPTSPTWFAETSSTSPSFVTGVPTLSLTSKCWTCFSLRSVSGQILRWRSGGDMASMLPIKNKKLESWSRNILRYIEKSCTSLGFRSCLVCHVESINIMACCSHWLNSKE